MKNYVLLTIPRTGSSFICDLISFYLLQNNLITDNLDEYFNQNLKIHDKYINYYLTDRLVRNTIDYPIQNITRKLHLLNVANSNGFAYSLKVFTSDLEYQDLKKLVDSSNVIALSRRDIKENILSHYMSCITDSRNIRDISEKINHEPNSVIFDPTLFHDNLIKQVKRIKDFNSLCNEAELKVFYYEDIILQNFNEILVTLGFKECDLSGFSTYIKLNDNKYIDIIQNKTEFETWYNNYV